jgi:hypothetical protein
MFNLKVGESVNSDIRSSGEVNGIIFGPKGLNGSVLFAPALISLALYYVNLRTAIL